MKELPIGIKASEVQLTILELVRWNNTWADMAAKGSCDDIGGVEYWRVRRDWIKAGKPSDLVEFIRQEANAR